MVIKRFFYKAVEKAVHSYLNSLSNQELLQIKKVHFEKSNSYKITALEAMKLYKSRFEIDVEYVDQNNHKRKFTYKAKNIPELMSLVSENPVQYLNANVKGILTIKFRVWYIYPETNSEELVSDFLVGGIVNDKKIYDLNALGESFKSIREFLKTHPELLL